MSDFEQNWRRIQEKRCRPFADKIYQQIFGDQIKITRSDDPNITPEEMMRLEKTLAIDIQIRRASGLIMTGQEKFLSAHQAKYRTITVEYMQNPNTKEEGDWYKLAAQFYFCGYENQDIKSFSPWIILDWAQVVIETEAGHIRWMERANKDGHARASFKYTFIDKIPVSCIIARDKPIKQNVQPLLYELGF